jgi:glycolate oxidase iron-sulfur subunit
MMNEQRYPELNRLSDEITRCGRCGFCQSVCPVYQVTAHEEGVARGRNMFARELLSGKLAISRENEGFFTECLLCRACVQMCFSSVKTDDIVLAVRRASRRVRGISRIQEHIFDHLLMDHRRLGRAIRFAAAGRSAGALKLAQALDVFGWYGGRFRRLDEFLSRIPEQSLRERLAARRISPRNRKEAVLFIGCGVNFMFPEAGEATALVLEKLGYRLTVADNCCCGLPAYVSGAVEAAQRLMAKNIEAISDSDALIITDCSSCASFLKKYPDIAAECGGDEVLVERARHFSSRVRDVTEVLAESAPALSSMRKITSKALRVTFHDPCHLSRHQELSLAARETLRSLANVDFVEMKEADWCCGGAGAFAFEHPALSLKILERKMRNIAATGADIVATTCPSCMMQLRPARQSGNLQVRHVVEIARDFLQKADED